MIPPGTIIGRDLIRIRNCRRKHAYRTKREAKRAVRHANKSGNVCPKIRRVYYCDTCNWYHVTSTKKRKGQHGHGQPATGA